MSVHNHFNAASQMVTIFSSKGEAVEVNRLNAIDLIRTSGFTWKIQSDTAIPQDAVEDSVEKVTPAPQPKDEPAAKDAVETQIDHKTAPLVDVAIAITGSDDVANYLNGFTADALRDMAAERYDEKIHHKTSPENIIEKILGFEEAKVAAEMDE